ncbi:MAG: S8 family serine peptidase [Flavobacteriaceae bacterium]
MKSKTFIAILLISLGILVSCEDWFITKKKSETTIIEQPSPTSTSTPSHEPTITANQIIVMYDETLSKDERDAIRDTLKNKIEPGTPLEYCSCGDQTIELITVQDTVDIEGAIGAVKGKGGGGVEAENQFTIILPLADPYKPIEHAYKNQEPSWLNTQLQKPKDNNHRVNIAIIDTGIDLMRNNGKADYLYDTSGNNGLGCSKEISGWNYVNGDDNISADHTHGTYVTKHIMEELDEHNVNYRILPIKAFNQDGRSDYWKIVCSMAYLKEIQMKNNDIHVINSSFGYTFRGYPINDQEKLISRNAILKAIIDELDKSTVMVTSAGNEDEDNDTPLTNAHYPSGFDSDNIVGVGGYIEDNGILDKDGNFGNNSIDLGAPYTGYQFEFNYSVNNINFVETVTATGSSYSAAFISSKIATLIYNDLENGTPLRQPADLLSTFLSTQPVKTSTQLDSYFVNGNYIDDH